MKKDEEPDYENGDECEFSFGCERGALNEISMIEGSFFPARRYSSSLCRLREQDTESPQGE